jgi:hypothetical protein
VRPSALVGKVHQDNVVQQLAIDFAAELGWIDIDGADGIALPVVYSQGKHGSVSLAGHSHGPSMQKPPQDSRRESPKRCVNLELES